MTLIENPGSATTSTPPEAMPEKEPDAPPANKVKRPTRKAKPKRKAKATKKPVKSKNKPANKPAKTVKKAKKAVKKTTPKMKKKKGKTAMDNSICKPQIRILQVLGNCKRPIGAEKLYKLAQLASPAWLSEYMGTKDSAHDGYIFRSGKKTPIRKLVPAGLVKRTHLVDETASRENGIEYQLTPAGRSKLEKLIAAPVAVAS